MSIETQKAKLYDLLERPVNSEKTLKLEEKTGTYTFKVRSDADKKAIKAAVEQGFGVTVTKVRTCYSRGKVKQRGKHIGKTKDWKKAYVTLQSGQALNFTFQSNLSKREAA